MNQKKRTITKMEKYLKHYDACAKEPTIKEAAISLQEHYSRMADCVGRMIKIVEGKD